MLNIQIKIKPNLNSYINYQTKLILSEIILQEDEHCAINE